MFYFGIIAQWRTPAINHERPQITSEPGYTNMDRCQEGDNALVIWHENYPFGKLTNIHLFIDICVFCRKNMLLTCC
jgi:hypothetical protein